MNVRLGAYTISTMAKSVYPTPKTSEQRLLEDRQRETRQKRQLPKVSWLTIPVYGVLVVWMLLLFIENIPGLWAAGNSAVIFFTFALWLFFGSLVLSWILYVNKVLYLHGWSRPFFWFSMSIIFVCSAALYARPLTSVPLEAHSQGCLVYGIGLFVSVLTLQVMNRQKK